MPHLPFNTASSATSNPPKVQPSIVLHVAPGNIYTTENASTHFNLATDVDSSSEPLSQSTAQITSAYRKRYASYIAATFKINIEAAQSETNYQLAPRRASETTSMLISKESFHIREDA
jgi:hypothetical protein